MIWNGIPLPSMSSSIVLPLLKSKVFPRNKSSAASPNTVEIFPPLHLREWAERYSAISLEALALFCWLVVYLYSSAGNLWETLQPQQTLLWLSSSFWFSSSRQLSMRGRTGLPQESWHPLRPCFQTIACWCVMGIKSKSWRQRLYLETSCA